MKVAVLLVLLAITAYVCLNVSTITATLNKDLFAFESIDAENLQGKPLVVFALPHGHCKASFPGTVTPHQPSYSQQLFITPLQSGENRVIADSKQVYYLSEFRLPALPMPTGDVTFAAIEYKKSFWGSSSNATPAGNNSLARSSNFNSEPLQIQNSLDAFSASWLTDRGAILDSKVPLALKGGLFSGREITAHSKDGKTSYKLRFYCNYPKKKMVVVGAAGERSRVNSSDTERFLNSIEVWS
ncbi:MAG: hypothetical protein WC028_27620 [Candidatus Obscuribacterales bacterium]